MIKILVTGASGFIGGHLIRTLREAGHDVLPAGIEFGDVSVDSTWMKFPKVDIVIHLAGKTFVPDSWIDPSTFIKCNLLGSVAALNYCKKQNARMVLLSSYLYGNPVSLPIPETAPLLAQNPYALSKKLAEEVCVFYSENFGINITILRPFNIYGLGQHESFLIPSIIRQIREGKEIRVKDLEPKRDYVYITDVVRAISKALHCKQRFNIFNIASGISHSVEEVINLIQHTMGTNIPVHSDEERRKGEIMNTVADITKAKLLLDWEPKWTLSQGIQQIISDDKYKG